MCGPLHSLNTFSHLILMVYLVLITVLGREGPEGREEEVGLASFVIFTAPPGTSEGTVVLVGVATAAATTCCCLT